LEGPRKVRIGKTRTMIRSLGVLLGGIIGLMATIQHSWFSLLLMITLWGVILLDLIEEAEGG